MDTDGSDFAFELARDVAMEQENDSFFRQAHPEDFECYCIHEGADYCPIHGYDTPHNRLVSSPQNDHQD